MSNQQLMNQPEQQTPWPPQGYQQAPIPPKKGFFSKKIGPVPVWAIIGVLIVIMVIVADVNTASKSISGTSLSSSGTSSSASSSNSSSSGNADSSSPTGPAKIGDTITVNNVACTLVAVKHLQGDGVIEPKAGNEFIIVHVKLMNNGNNEVNYNEFDFHVISGSGNVTDAEIVVPGTYTANNALNSGALTPGGTVEGDIIFQVHIGDHKAELSWKPNFFSRSTDNVWNLGI